MNQTTRCRPSFLATTAVLALALAVAACDEGGSQTLGSAEIVLTPAEFVDLPGWGEGRFADAFGAFRRSCRKLTALPAAQAMGADGMAGTAGDWLGICAAAELAVVGPAIDETTARGFFETGFRPFAVAAAAGGEGKFTGYYEAELRGSRTRKPPYVVPIHRRPGDLGEGPYADRAAIMGGALDGRDLELMWVDDPVDAFILHIQGSGRVRFEDGAVARLGYADNNGHAYVAIGRLMRERGLLPPDNINMPAIRDWLRAHPVEGAALMAENPRYIFFRERVGANPVGAQGVSLTPGHSLAVDAALIPLGAPLWLDTTWPAMTRPLRRLVIAQDTGAAITGAVRGDLFWGAGEEAFERAGRMNQSGRYYILLPRVVADAR